MFVGIIGRHQHVKNVEAHLFVNTEVWNTGVWNVQVAPQFVNMDALSIFVKIAMVAAYVFTKNKDELAKYVMVVHIVHTISNILYAKIVAEPAFVNITKGVFFVKIVKVRKSANTIQLNIAVNYVQGMEYVNMENEKQDVICVEVQNFVKYATQT